MAWIPQSNVARGLGNTLAIVRARPSLAGTALVFITDGDEAPDVRVSTERIAALPGDRAAGLLVGAGDVRPSAVPILNQWGRTTGYFQSGGNTYLSALQEEYLQNLAGQAGLDYMRLGERPGLTERLRSGRYARRVDKPGEVSWVFALLALGLLVAAYLPWPGRRRHR